MVSVQALMLGLGAGLVSGLLFASAASGSLLALALFYLAPLPGLIAGFGWGLRAAILAASTGTLLVAMVLGPSAGTAYGLTLALPTVIICYLMFLYREDASSKAPESLPGKQNLIWYPIDLIIPWTAVIAGVISLVGILLSGTDMEGYRNSLKTLIEKALADPGVANSPLAKMSPAKRDQFIDALVAVMPAISAVLWFGATLINMWLAGKISVYSGRSARPWPDLGNLEYPPRFALALGFCLFAAIFAPGIVSTVASGFAGPLLIAYVLLGLSIIHLIASTVPIRYFVLVMVYSALILFGWPAFLIAGIGMLEPVLQLRQRFTSGPPQGPA